MAGRRSSHVLDAHRTRGLQHHPPCGPPRGPAAAARRTTWHMAVRGWRRPQSQARASHRKGARASHRKGATPFPHRRVMKTFRDADKSAGADLGWQQEDRLRAKGAKLILKCDTQKNCRRTA